MTHLKSLRITNFLRFRGEHEVELDPGVWGLVARDAADPRRSNWLGKSSVFGALRWLFFGTRVMGLGQGDSLDDLISRGESEMAVEVELSDGCFVSRRRRRGRTQRDLYVERGGPPLSGDAAQAEIDRMLGASEDDLLSTAWCEQDELPSLVRATSTEATALVRGWARLERLERASDEAVAELGEAGEELERRAAALRDLEARIDAVAYLELEEDEAEEEERLAALEVEWTEYRALLPKIARTREHERLGQQLVEIERRLARPIAVPTGEDVDELTRLAEEAGAEARRANEERERHRKLLVHGFDGACPVARGFACPAAPDVTARVEEDRALYGELSAEAARLQKAFAEARDARDTARARELGKVREDEARAADERRKAEITRRMTELSAEGLWVGDEISPPPVDKTRLSMIRAQLEEHRKASASLEGARAAVEQARRRVAVAREAARVLGPEGALRRASEGVVRAVTEEGSRVLAAAGVELSLREEWSVETGQPLDRCLACGRRFSVREKQCGGCGAARETRRRHCFRLRPSARSGAGRALGGLAARCGAARWLASARGSELSLAWFDEPLSSLDEAHREAVSRGLAKMLGASFEQVIVADHHRGFMDALPRRMVVIGEGEWSSLTIEK